MNLLICGQISSAEDNEESTDVEGEEGGERGRERIWGIRFQQSVQRGVLVLVLVFPWIIITTTMFGVTAWFSPRCSLTLTHFLSTPLRCSTRSSTVSLPAALSPHQLLILNPVHAARLLSDVENFGGGGGGTRSSSSVLLPPPAPHPLNVRSKSHTDGAARRAARSRREFRGHGGCSGNRTENQQGEKTLLLACLSLSLSRSRAPPFSLSPLCESRACKPTEVQVNGRCPVSGRGRSSAAQTRAGAGELLITRRG